MKNKYDVIVVGGGPAGSMAAMEIAKANYSVCVLEKTRDIGYPVRCGEAIGFTGLNQFVKPKDSWIASNIKAVNLISPNNIDVKIRFNHETGYILNRRVFDYELSNIAVKEGAKIYTKAYVHDLIIEDNFIKGVKVNYLGEEKEIKSKIVIGADGIESRVGRWGGIKTTVKMKDMESCIKHNECEMTMYVGKEYAPGGYLWVFPKGNSMANIGIGISGKYSRERSAKDYLDDFLRKNYPDVSILTTVCGGVICDKPLSKPVNNGLMLVGDAAHQTNPMTGGGIASGMKGGQIAGIVASEALLASNFHSDFLMKYPNRMFKEFGNNYTKLYKIKETINNLSDKDLNDIALSVKKIPEERRKLASVFKQAVYKKPKLIIDVLKIFAGF